MPRALIIKPNDIGIVVDLSRQASDGMLLGDISARDPVPGAVDDLVLFGTPTTTAATVRWTRVNDGNDQPANYLVAIQQVPPSPAPFDGNALFFHVDGSGGAIGTIQEYTFFPLASGRAFEARVVAYRGNEEFYADPADSNVIGFSTQSVIIIDPPGEPGEWRGHEPEGMTVMTDRQFHAISFVEDGIAEDWWHLSFFNGDWGNIVDEPTPSGDNKSLRILIRQGDDGTLATARTGYLFPTNQRPRRLYHCYYGKVSSNWQYNDGPGDKFTYVHGTPGNHYIILGHHRADFGYGGPSTAGVIEGFWTRQGLEEFNIFLGPNTGNPGIVPRGAWALHEYLMIAESSPGGNDGQFHMWIDGEKTVQRTNLTYFSTPNERRFTGVTFEPIYGGGPVTPTPAPQYKHIDRFYVSGADF